jgi:AcrR family transcriptional regulator
VDDRNQITVLRQQVTIVIMRDWIPVPGSVKARLVEAAIHQFELAGYAAVNVVDLAAKASVTTGALYHHFDSKLGLYLVVREEMEKRIVERMQGAAAAAGGRGRPAVRAALLVAFDAAVRFTVCRILGEPHVDVERDDPVAAVLRPLLTKRLAPAAGILAAAWRAALLAVAGGTPVATARTSLLYLLDEGGT